MDDAKTITVVTGDDWSGVYIDGLLDREGHSIDCSDMLEIIDSYKCFKNVADYEIDLEYLEDLGSLPYKFEDIPKEKLFK
ncbi:hypothetical protein JOC34_000589 [Virgibacillus halotolerans]|uniref:hypothetical protein n=1 Tax=Virgibacillus halotolerans TaxID=1071053 RepID=UPI0019607D0A|nr:hypothetical protein [Virgibacillus halotolerans]MBM7598232.1 hypothetical protein [Virgibacillus halotolerans]